MRMTEEQRNDFVNENMGIIGDVITKPFKNKNGNFKQVAEMNGYEYADLVSEGVIGMIEGISNYNIDKATKDNGDVVPLEAFVRWDIRRKISEFIAKPRKHDRAEYKLSMQHKIGKLDSSGKQATVEDMLHNTAHDVDEVTETKMDLERLNNLLSSDLLTDTEIVAIDARFLKGYKLKDVNEVLIAFTGNPKAKGFYFIGTALKKLKKALEA